MTSWKIVTDSSCDFRYIDGLPPQVDFEAVPFNITIGNDTIVDDGNTPTSEVIEAFRREKQKSTTACPSPESFAKTFEEADNVICITISSQLSGSYNSANIAKNIVLEKYPQKNIYILDSKSASTEMNLLVSKCLELIQDNLEFDALIQQLHKYHHSLRINFLSFSVNNLVKNGRVPKIIGQMIGMLGINLIGRRTPQGTIELAHKSKGKKRSFKAMVKEMKNQGYDGGHIDITHANNEENAQEFIEFISQHYPHLTYTLHLATNLNAYYAEDGGLILSYHHS